MRVVFASLCREACSRLHKTRVGRRRPASVGIAMPTLHQ
jgi:hypothetical protein